MVCHQHDRQVRPRRLLFNQAGQRSEISTQQRLGRDQQQAGTLFQFGAQSRQVATDHSLEPCLFEHRQGHLAVAPPRCKDDGAFGCRLHGLHGISSICHSWDKAPSRIASRPSIPVVALARFKSLDRDKPASSHGQGQRDSRCEVLQRAAFSLDPGPGRRFNEISGRVKALVATTDHRGSSARVGPAGSARFAAARFPSSN
ncbi:hypothetical protein D3C72_1641620 [compost metagenome]